jgi:hypothetical protein
MDGPSGSANTWLCLVQNSIGSGFGQGRGFFTNLAYEAEALAWKGPDQPLFVAIVADRGARRIDTAAKRCLRDDASLPDRGEELVAADNPFPCPNEEFKEIKNLRFHGNQTIAAAQFAPVNIKDNIVKTVKQNRPRRLGQLGANPAHRLPQKSWQSEG